MTRKHDINTLATHWASRVAGVRLPHEEWLEFKAWFALDSRHRIAFLRAYSERSRQRRFDGSQLFKVAACLGVLALGLILAIVLRFQASPKAFTACAPLGGHRLIALPDGSSVDLNTTTCVSAVFSDRKRLVRLESGEAIFQVAHDPVRPFIVETGHASITDIGTRFVVYRIGNDTRVTVFEGTVEVSTQDRTARTYAVVNARQQFEGPADGTQQGKVRPITPADLERETAWLHRSIEFNNQTVSEVLAEFARYKSIQVAATDPEIMNIPVSGVFPTTDVDGFLRLLAAMCIHTTSSYDSSRQLITLSRKAGGGRYCR